MFDCHYDLLTYIYINKNNLKEVKKHCNKIFKNSISGGIFNLFYMSPEEMKKDLNIDIKEIDIIKNLDIVNKLIKEKNLIPQNVSYIYGIEGLGYLKRIEDIDILHKLGVKSVNIVWNNDNKFGGGINGDQNKGLTPFGKKLIEKIVDTNIAIDLSHTNEKTFYDIINICTKLKEGGKNPKVFASHSNIRSICNHKRNLTDKQILKIKELNGIIGIVSVKPFCIKEKRFNNNKNKYENAYIKHIQYLKELLHGIENIAVSTDDMKYYKTCRKYYKHFNVFKQENMKAKLEKQLLKNNFSQEEIEKILYKNAKTFLEID